MNKNIVYSVLSLNNDYEFFQSGVKGPDPESAGGIKGSQGAPVRQTTQMQTDITWVNKLTNDTHLIWVMKCTGSLAETKEL